MVAIFWMSSRSDPIPGLRLVGGTDKLAHAAAYALLGLLLTRAFFKTWPRQGILRMAMLGVVVASVYGALDELHQTFVPGRHASLGDVAADCVGAMLGACFYLVLIRSRGLDETTTNKTM